MKAATVTPQLLKQQLGQVLHSRADKGEAGLRVVAVQSPQPWRGPEHLTVDETTFRLVWCPSTLAVREQLAAAPPPEEPLVLLTDREEGELGTDVLARLPGGRLITIDRLGLLRQCFQADRLDPRLAQDGWLADELLAVVPPGGFPPAPTGFLDLDAAWSALLIHRFGFPDGHSDLPDLLEWSRPPENLVRLERVRDEVREGVVGRFRETAGVPGEAVGRLVLTGRGRDAVAAGLACRVLFHAGDEGKAQRSDGAIRLESALGGLELAPDAGRRWADVAEALVDRLQDSSHRSEVRQHLSRGDELLAELKVATFAHLSAHLPSGLEQRSARYAEALRNALKAPARADLAELERRAEELLQHRLVSDTSRTTVEAAPRLLRWLAQENNVPVGSFPQAALRYAEHGSFADRLRTALFGSEADERLGDAHSALLEQAETRRETENRRFGELLHGWFEADSSNTILLPVEKILEQVVAPVAELAPVLLVVVDGLSLPVFRELQSDLESYGWTEIVPEEGPRQRLGLSLLPSVTRVSRFALLTGRRGEGIQGDEKRGFEEHVELRRRTQGGSPPVLFHKAEVRSDDAAALNPDLVAAIGDTQHRRVVGVVLNAVDDFLAKSDELRPRWTVETIRAMEALLRAAAANERLVVLTADHGHVPEHGSEYRKQDESGDRYRKPTVDPGDGEMLVRGPRVLAPEQRLVVPWSEKVRYTPRKNGYHGGAAPQEMLVPIAVFTSDVAGDVPSGWSAVPPFRPSWWIAAAAGDADDRKRPVSRPAARPQAALFPAAGERDWISELLDSDTYRSQVDLAGRVAPDEDLMRDLLTALDERGGTMSRTALGQRLGLPTQRLDARLGAVERVLNVEGFPVIEFDRASGQVSLNRTLLAEQFELPPPRA